MEMPVGADIMLNSPPPTINSLKPSQRTRLLKSTRKLEHLLGATPHFLDSDSVTKDDIRHRKHKIKHVYLSSSAASSVTSLASCGMERNGCPRLPIHPTDAQLPPDVTAKERGKQKSVCVARPPVLRLHTAPFITTQPQSSARTDVVQITTSILPIKTMSPSPPSPTFSLEDGPMSPIDVPHEKIWRKRMVKLTHMLGENIPPELIFSSQYSQHHMRSPDPSPRWTLSPEYGRKEVEVTRSHSPLEQYPNLCIVSTAHSVKSFTVLPFLSTSKLPLVRKHRRKSANADFLTLNDVSSTNSVVSSLRGEEPSRSAGLSGFTMAEDNYDDMDMFSWNGEWSIKDAEKRAAALRNLRS